MTKIQMIRRFPAIKVRTGCYRETYIPVVWTRIPESWWSASTETGESLFPTFSYRLDAARLDFYWTLGWSIERMAGRLR